MGSSSRSERIVYLTTIFCWCWCAPVINVLYVSTGLHTIRVHSDWHRWLTNTNELTKANKSNLIKTLKSSFTAHKVAIETNMHYKHHSRWPMHKKGTFPLIVRACVYHGSPSVIYSTKPTYWDTEAEMTLVSLTFSVWMQQSWWSHEVSSD